MESNAQEIINATYEERIKKLEQTVENYNGMFRELIYQIQSLSGVIAESHELNVKEHAFMTSQLNNLGFEVNDPITESEFFYPQIVDVYQTVDKIIKEKKSIARFGDGEFAIIFGHNRQPFQMCDDKLAHRLEEVLQSDIPDLLIGIANNYGNLEKYTDFAADGIRIYMQPDIRREHMQVLDREKTYYDAYMTRPYVMYRDKFTDAPRKRFEQLQQIWQGRDVIMIEGAQTRLGVGNDLFDNCKSIQRILAPATNSYSRYDEILEAAKMYAAEGVLFLIATGPSAGVFAYDLVLEGYQAIDVGHIDVEYEWMKKGTGEREPLPNKYTNEIPGDEVAEDIQDPVYESQIIASFL